MRRLPLIVLAACTLAAGCGSDDPTASEPATTAAPATTAPAAPAPPPSTPADVATGLQVPWGLVPLPDGGALVSERASGRILRIPAGGGEPRVEMTVPGVDPDAGEGGLLGIALSPEYGDDGLVYAFLTTAQDNRIERFRLGEEPRPVLTGLARGSVHNGGRIAFGPDGRLYAGVGDTGDTSLPQDPGSLNGKILRMEPDGSVPADNPGRSLVWSSGHRNVQGLAWDADGRLWATEFGQNDVDEVNLIRPGANYGWPEVEGKGGREEGFTEPLVTWPTSEASPSGAAIAGDDLYVAALRGERLWRLPLDGARAGTPTAHLQGELGRLRSVELGPDGALWIATSNTDGRGSPQPGDDRIVRVGPPGGDSTSGEQTREAIP